jgi:hypothetical protein
MPLDDLTEACGIKPITFRGFPKAACQIHDRMYVRGSWAQANLTRKEADEHFLLMLLTISGRNPLKRAASYLMYGAVRILGAPYWEGK